MRRPRSRWLIVALLLAAAAEIFDAAGWWHWTSLRHELEHDPQAGVARLAGDLALALPPVVEASWRRSSSVLSRVGNADPVTVKALERIGLLQVRWLPSNSVGYLNRARAELLNGNLRAGQELVREALARNPTSPYLLRLLAILLRRAGYPEEFLNDLAEARAIAPGYDYPPVELTPEDEQWVNLEAIRRRIDLYPRERVKVMIELANEQRKAGDLESAKKTLEQVAGEPLVRLEMARWDLEEGDSQAAEAAAQGIASERFLPSSLRVEAWSLVARARAQSGDQDGALAAANEAMKLGPSSPAPYLALASMAERRGDDKGALTMLRKAWGCTPGDENLLLRVARVAERCGKLADARLALKRAAEVAPQRPDIQAALISFSLRHGEYMFAANQLSRALDRFPTDPKLIELAGRLHAEVTE